jgi:hypothetical protein
VLPSDECEEVSRLIDDSERTPEQKAELKQLESMLPSVVENLLGVQKDLGMSEHEEAATHLSSREKEDSKVPDLSEDFEPLKKVSTRSSAATSAASS